MALLDLAPITVDRFDFGARPSVCLALEQVGAGVFANDIPVVITTTIHPDDSGCYPRPVRCLVVGVRG